VGATVAPEGCGSAFPRPFHLPRCLLTWPVAVGLWRRTHSWWSGVPSRYRRWPMHPRRQSDVHRFARHASANVCGEDGGTFASSGNGGERCTPPLDHGRAPPDPARVARIWADVRGWLSPAAAPPRWVKPSGGASAIHAGRSARGKSGQSSPPRRADRPPSKWRSDGRPLAHSEPISAVDEPPRLAHTATGRT
jgi:hypothetical protein